MFAKGGSNYSVYIAELEVKVTLVIPPSPTWVALGWSFLSCVARMGS